MGRVQTNATSYSVCTETSPGVASTSWTLLQPNDITDFGASITTVARNPISRNRQRQKGTVTDLDSPFGYQTDLTLASLRNFIEGFVFATGKNSDVVQLVTTAATATGSLYTLQTALDAVTATRFQIDSLVYVINYTNSLNSGLKTVDTGAVDTDTTISVGETLADETAPAKARLSFAGFRIPAVGSPTWTWDAPSSQATLTETGLGTKLAALGLVSGASVHIGSLDSAGNVQNAFENTAANDMYGNCRVVSISTDDVVFDRTDVALQFTDATAPATPVDVVFGEFIRNRPVGDPEFLERTYQVEAEWPNLDTGGASMYSYSIGNYANQMTLNMPLTDKAGISFGFIGLDTENPVAVASRKAGAATALAPVQVAAVNTTSDFARLRIIELDETGLTTDFADTQITFNNNIAPEKVLGVLGPKFINFGDFAIDLQTQVVFSNAEVLNAIRNYTSVGMDFILGNPDGMIIVDIPSLSLGGGALNLTPNESAKLDTTGAPEEDPILATSIGVSVIHVPLRP